MRLSAWLEKMGGVVTELSETTAVNTSRITILKQMMDVNRELKQLTKGENNNERVTLNLIEERWKTTVHENGMIVSQ